MSIEKKYTDFYLKTKLSKVYPDEFIVRIFLGTYPNHHFDKDFSGKKILDVGMGDGRHLKFFVEQGFDVYGTEITQVICNHVNKQFLHLGYAVNCKKGRNHMLPFNDSYFNYLVSWNSSYYMGNINNNHDYLEYLREFARVMKQGGYFIASIPQKSCFIYDNVKDFTSGYKIILDDPYKIRNGEIMRCFESLEEIIDVYSIYFKDFHIAEKTDNCFGQKNHHYIIVCKKK